MRLLEAYSLLFIVPTVAYLAPTDDKHGGTLRSELHFNISDDAINAASHIRVGHDGATEVLKDAMMKHAEALGRDHLAVAQLLNGHSKVGESGGASGNVSCSCTGEEMAKLTCTCTPLAVVKNETNVSGNKTTTQPSLVIKPPPVVPLEGTATMLTHLAAPLQAAPVQPVSFLSPLSVLTSCPGLVSNLGSAML